MYHQISCCTRITFLTFSQAEIPRCDALKLIAMMPSSLISLSHGEQALEVSLAPSHLASGKWGFRLGSPHWKCVHNTGKVGHWPFWEGATSKIYWYTRFKKTSRLDRNFKCILVHCLFGTNVYAPIGLDIEKTCGCWLSSIHKFMHVASKLVAISLYTTAIYTYNHVRPLWFESAVYNSCHPHAQLNQSWRTWCTCAQKTHRQ